MTARYVGALDDTSWRWVVDRCRPHRGCGWWEGGKIEDIAGLVLRSGIQVIHDQIPGGDLVQAGGVTFDQGGDHESAFVGHAASERVGQNPFGQFEIFREFIFRQALRCSLFVFGLDLFEQRSTTTCWPLFDVWLNQDSLIQNEMMMWLNIAQSTKSGLNSFLHELKRCRSRFHENMRK